MNVHVIPSMLTSFMSSVTDEHPRHPVHVDTSFTSTSHMSHSNFMYCHYHRNPNFMYYNYHRNPDRMMSVSASSTDCVNWTISEHLPVTWESICYVDSPYFRSTYSAPVFVALCYVDYLDTIAISTDGINWTFTPMNIIVRSSKPFTVHYTSEEILGMVLGPNPPVIGPNPSITYCSPSTDTNGLFVIVTQYKVMTSTDAINWTIIDTSKCDSPEFGCWKPINFTYGRVGDRDCYIFTNTYGRTYDAYITITTDLNEWITYPLKPESGEPVKVHDIMSASMCCGDNILICLCRHSPRTGYFTKLLDISHPPSVEICDYHYDLKSIIFGPASNGRCRFLSIYANRDMFMTWEYGMSYAKWGEIPLKTPSSICQSPMHDGTYIITCNLERNSQLLRTDADVDVNKKYEFEVIKVGSGQKWQRACEGGGRVVILSAESDANYGNTDDASHDLIIAVSESLNIGDYVSGMGYRIPEEDVVKQFENGFGGVYVVQRLLPGKFAIVRAAKMPK